MVTLKKENIRDMLRLDGVQIVAILRSLLIGRQDNLSEEGEEVLHAICYGKREDYKTRILSDRIFVERLCINTHISPNLIETYLDKFEVSNILFANENHQSFNDYKRHFVHWLISERKRERDADFDFQKRFNRLLYSLPRERKDKLMFDLSVINEREKVLNIPLTEFKVKLADNYTLSEMRRMLNMNLPEKEKSNVLPF